MGYFLDAARALGVTIKNAFRTPTTVEFPKEKRERAERYRASFALLHDENGEELCIGCLACERICPSEIITVKPGPKVESPFTGKKRGTVENLTLDLNACIYCELCVQVCPTDAIVMVRQPETPAYSREALFLSMERLYENEKHKDAAWATGKKLVDMQDPKRGAPKPEKKAPPKKPAPAGQTKPEPETTPETEKKAPPKKPAPAGEKKPAAEASKPEAEKPEPDEKKPEAEKPEAEKPEPEKKEADA